MIRIFLVIIFLATITAIYFFDLNQYFTLEYLKDNYEQYQSFYKENPISCILLYSILYIVAVAISFPGAIFFTLFSGALFGPLLGFFIATISATIGSLIVFVLSRYVFKSYLENLYPKQFKMINDGVDSDGIYYLLTLRLHPVFPFFLVNLLVGVTAVKIRDYLWTTYIGIIPTAIIYSVAGGELSEIRSAADIVSLNMLIVLSLLGVMPIILRIIYHRFA